MVKLAILKLLSEGVGILRIMLASLLKMGVADWKEGSKQEASGSCVGLELDTSI